MLQSRGHGRRRCWHPGGQHAEPAAWAEFVTHEILRMEPQAWKAIVCKWICSILKCYPFAAVAHFALGTNAALTFDCVARPILVSIAVPRLCSSTRELCSCRPEPNGKGQIRARPPPQMVPSCGTARSETAPLAEQSASKSIICTLCLARKAPA